MGDKVKDEQPLEDFERLLLFFYCLKQPPKDKETQMKLFRKISGMTETQSQSALDACVIKQFVGD